MSAPSAAVRIVKETILKTLPLVGGYPEVARGGVTPLPRVAAPGSPDRLFRPVFPVPARLSLPDVAAAAPRVRQVRAEVSAALNAGYICPVGAGPTGLQTISKLIWHAPPVCRAEFGDVTLFKEPGVFPVTVRRLGEALAPIRDQPED